MQRPEDHRIDLAELKAHIVKKIGVERSRRYFYYLGRFLSQKLTKFEFDKSCHRLLGRENLPLHNKLVHSILRNASLAKSPPHGHKSLVLGKEDGPEQRGYNRNDHVWFNGVLPKVAIRDRPSPLGPNGKVGSLLHQPNGRDDKRDNRDMENGDFVAFGYHRPGRYADERGGALLDKGKAADAFSRDEEGQEERGRLTLSTSPVVAPLGIPFWAASVGGARRRAPGSTEADFISCYDSGGLSGTEMLRKRMENIAVAQGLGAVSPECTSMLDKMLDLYLKRLIKSCVDMSGGRSINGMSGNQSNSLQIQTSNQPSATTGEQHPVSLLDFRVAMELNPSQLGEGWPLLRERLLMRSFEEGEGV